MTESSAMEKRAKKAIAERGCGPLNYSLLEVQQTRRGKAKSTCQTTAKREDITGKVYGGLP
jgi:hypothetical protein